jgi:hypothetical protein
MTTQVRINFRVELLNNRGAYGLFGPRQSEWLIVGFALYTITFILELALNNGHTYISVFSFLDLVKADRRSGDL